MALPTSAADAGVSGISLDQVISVAGLNPEDANFLKGRIDDSMRQQFLGMRTMREFEALAARFLFSAPGAPSPAKLMQLKNSLQEALQRADLLQDKTVVELAEGAATGAGGNAEAEVARKRLTSELNSAGRASSSVPTVASSLLDLAEMTAREVLDLSAEMDQAGIVGDKKRRLEGSAETSIRRLREGTRGREVVLPFVQTGLGRVGYEGPHHLLAAEASLSLLAAIRQIRLSPAVRPGTAGDRLSPPPEPSADAQDQGGA